MFSGPVQPEATPNPRHVRFVIGGAPAPGVWFRRGDELTDDRVSTLLDDPDVADVLVAGDFVAIGLRRATMWKDRLDDLVERVTDLFWSPERVVSDLDGPTREPVASGQTAGALHLLDPDDPTSRTTLETALVSDDARQRRMAVATLAQSGDEGYAMATLRTGYADPGARSSGAPLSTSPSTSRPKPHAACWNTPWQTGTIGSGGKPSRELRTWPLHERGRS